jgi:HEPN domain-containing protein
LSDEFADNLLKNVYKLWVIPEVQRRLRDGALSGETKVWAAQVLFEVGSPVEVRLNDEINGTFHVDEASPIPEGTTVDATNFHTVAATVRAFELADDRPNAGHITLLHHADGYYIDFDLRYNAQAVADHIVVAREFLETARESCERGRLRATIANLHVATELLAKAHLLLHPDDAVMTARTHGFLRARYNLHSHRGGTEPRFAALLNRLDEARNPARYVAGSFNVGATEALELLNEATSMLEFVLAATPSRTRRWVAQGA